MLAAWAIGATDDLDALSGMVREERRFEPRSDGPLAGALARYQALSQVSAVRWAEQEPPA